MKVQYLSSIYGNKCVYCGGKAESVDHIKPRSKGGGNELENLAPACHECNKKKSNKDVLIFLQENEIDKDINYLKNRITGKETQGWSNEEILLYKYGLL